MSFPVVRIYNGNGPLEQPMKQPTSEQCSANAELESVGSRRAFAIWYPQMGGYVGHAVVVLGAGPEDCFDVYVWHDTEFPIPDEDVDSQPLEIRHCEAEQFIRFGEIVQRLAGQDPRADVLARESDEARASFDAMISQVSRLGSEKVGLWVKLRKTEKELARLREWAEAADAVARRTCAALMCEAPDCDEPATCVIPDAKPDNRGRGLFCPAHAPAHARPMPSDAEKERWLAARPTRS